MAVLEMVKAAVMKAASMKAAWTMEAAPAMLRVRDICYGRQRKAA